MMKAARMRTIVAVIVVGAVAALAGLTGCTGGDPRPSIILITVDTLRADHLGSYG